MCYVYFVHGMWIVSSVYLKCGVCVHGTCACLLCLLVVWCECESKNVVPLKLLIQQAITENM